MVKGVLPNSDRTAQFVDFIFTPSICFKNLLATSLKGSSIKDSWNLSPNIRY